MVTIQPRSSWSPAGRDGDTGLSGLATEVFLHHTVTAQLPASASVSQEKAQMRAIERVGISRGFGGISYNVIIFPSGRAYQGVSWQRRGFHTGGRNSTTRSICFAGNYETNEPTSAQLATAAAIFAHGKGRWWTRGAPLRGHRDIKSTACPGKNVYKHRAAIQSGAVSGATTVSNPVSTWTGAMGWPKLRPGDKGAPVGALQRRLVALGYDVGSHGVDNSFGDDTTRAVKAFQTDQGLDADAVVGKDTQTALKAPKNTPKAPAPKEDDDMALDHTQRIPVRGAAVESLGGRTELDVGAWVGYAAAGGFEAMRRLPRIEATLAAQAAAIEALATATGADPDTIAKAVTDAIDRRLSDFEITFRASEG